MPSSRRGGTSSSKCLVPDGRAVPTGPGGTIVCFPSAGAGVGMFRGWSNDLGGAWAVQRVRLAGRESRMDERHPPSLEVAAEEIVPSIAPLVAPVVLLGHSMGGLLAYETARQCEVAGVNITGLVVIAAPAPTEPPRFARPGDLDRVAPQGDDEATLAVQDMMRPTLLRDLRLCAGYPPQDQKLRARALAIWGHDDETVGSERIEAWASLFAGRTEVIGLPGGHHLVTEQRVSVTAAVSAWLS